jgi:hypothetical protein
MKKSTKSLACLFTIIFTLGINSCKKEHRVSSGNSNTALANAALGNATLIAISHLPASEQITLPEMKAWFEKVNASGLQPQWSKGVEMFYHGRQVVEIPTSADAALFFTKSKGLLNVEAYKWLDKAPGARLFSGNVLYYSFATNK